MDHAIPPSPASSVRERSSVDLNQPPQHHGITSLPRCSSSPLGVVQFDSRSASRYHTPEPRDINQYIGLGMAYTQPRQGPPLHYAAMQGSDDASAYDVVPSTSTPQLYNLNTPEASPTTVPQQLAGSPSVSSMAGSQKATHGMKALAVKSGRIEKATPSKKKPVSVSVSSPTPKKEKTAAKAAASASSEESSIKQPLSVLAKDWDVPFVDIEAYVSRSEDDRRDEVDRGKVPGKVKRAMNAFMLYRKAYQDAAKKFAQQSNHQIVSKVCGRSWAMEPDSVRRQFNDWAVMERDNHRKAHPEYKFTPSKPRKKGKDELDEDSDVDDANWGSGSHRDPIYRSTSRTPMLDPQAGAYGYQFGTPHVSDVHSYQSFDRRPQHNISSLARHASAPYDPDEYASGSTSHYRQVLGGHQHRLDSMAYANSAQQNLSVNSAHHSAGHHSFDMAGQFSSQTGAMQQQALGVVSHGGSSAHGLPAVGVGQQIDPTLMPRDPMSQYDISNPVLAAGVLDDNQWHASFPSGADPAELYPGPYVATIEESYIQDAHLQYLGDDAWKINPSNEAEDWHSLGES